MVDADTAITFGPASSAGAMPPAIAIHGGIEALRHYREACRGARFAPPQDPLWVESWMQAGGHDLVCAVLSVDDHPILALALQVEARAGFRTARFVGGSHANGNFAASTAQAPGSGYAPILVEAMRAARPDIDMLALERQAPALDGLANPLLELRHGASPNIALAANLSGGFEALLERVNGKRKRKKYRSQLRKFEEAGGFRRFRAANPSDIERVLAAFFEMRHARFAAQGIDDVFAGAGVRDAFRNLYVGALASPSPAFFLDALEVGGTIRAVTGSSICQDRLICDFCGFSDDELTVASPGEFLFYENIREACENKMAIYDFSVGEERYKRAWCDIETVQFDTFLPLTLKGRLLAAGLSTASAVKRSVKNNPALWRLAKSVRRTRATVDRRPDDGA